MFGVPRADHNFRGKSNIINLCHIILHYFFLKIKLDKGFQKDMYELKVYCIACEWFGRLRNYQVFISVSHYYVLKLFV
jgi:hypothetical protein